MPIRRARRAIEGGQMDRFADKLRIHSYLLLQMPIRRARSAIEGGQMNRCSNWSRIALALMVACISLGMPLVWAQTLGTAPQFNVAVQGQTGAQPEGAFFNFINWIGNVVAPVAAGGAVFGAVVGLDRQS